MTAGIVETSSGKLLTCSELRDAMQALVDSSCLAVTQDGDELPVLAVTTPCPNLIVIDVGVEPTRYELGDTEL